jgi:DNA-directed RNA polymerase specialized sigma24 family protein
VQANISVQQALTRDCSLELGEDSGCNGSCAFGHISAMESPLNRQTSDARFMTTRWSLVRSAARGDEEARRSLNELCVAYWYPLYAFVRRKGHHASEAEDLTQGFFSNLLSGPGLGIANQERGRFRTFLLSALGNYMVNEWHRDQAQKRGAGQPTLSIDWQAAENRYGLEPATDLSPEKLFERSWALSVLDRSMLRVEEDFSKRGRGDLFEALKARITPYSGEQGMSELATKFEMTEGTLRVALHSLRGKFRDALRSEVGETLDSAEEVEDELRGLFEALG